MFVVDDLVALVVIAVVYSEHDRGRCRCCLAVGGVRCCCWSIQRAGVRPAARSTSLLGVVDLGGAAGQRRRPGGGRPGDRADRAGVLAEPRTTWRRRPGWSGCSASSRRPSWPGRPRVGLTSTLSPNARLQTLLPPVDELRDRAAVRAGQRRHRAQRRLPARTPTPRRSPSASSLGYVVGKPIAVVGTSWLVTRLSRGPDPAAGRLGRGARQRHDRRHRLHRRRC